MYSSDHGKNLKKSSNQHLIIDNSIAIQSSDEDNQENYRSDVGVKRRRNNNAVIIADNDINDKYHNERKRPISSVLLAKQDPSPLHKFGTPSTKKKLPPFNKEKGQISSSMPIRKFTSQTNKENQFIICADCGEVLLTTTQYK